MMISLKAVPTINSHRKSVLIILVC